MVVGKTKTKTKTKKYIKTKITLLAHTFDNVLQAVCYTVVTLLAIEKVAINDVLPLKAARRDATAN